MNVLIAIAIEKNLGKRLKFPSLSPRNGISWMYSSPGSLSLAEAVMESVQNLQMTQARLPTSRRLCKKKKERGRGRISGAGTQKAKKGGDDSETLGRSTSMPEL